MKNLFSLVLLTFALILSSCSANQKAESKIKSGNYDQAFDIAFTGLSKDKSDDDLVLTLKEAYDKANERDLKQIELLRTQNNPANLKKIYGLYEQIDARQYQVIHLQPLKAKGKEVNFSIKDYTNEIATAKKNYSDYLYNAANEKMKGTKLDAREAYKLYTELEYFSPTYVKNLSDLVSKAKAKGSSFVYLKLDNKVANVTAQEDITDLMNISESNLTDKWVIIHKTKEKNQVYDYQIDVVLNKTLITPQQVNTETVQQQARVKDGWEYVLDSKGNVMKDSLGNDMKRDKIITVQAELKLFQQVKSGSIEGTFSTKNIKTNSVLNTTPAVGQANFENKYGLYRGDQRAIEQKYYELLQAKEVPFPADNEFIKYSIADLKAKLVDYIDKSQLQ